ncbi:MAG: tetratricopeptide repeat-containing serine/threonine-protein kinase [Verrucomicrobiales bacterium]|nr:tetratricopeptide repeat-containing serine/threonine-protein kinase [Verrucomicrobiales bacterium]
MRLPELSGYRLEKLLGEDPFGWSYLAGKGESDKRLLRILKSQATLDKSIGEIYRHISALPHCSGVAAVDRFSQRMVGIPSAISSQFPGWKAKNGWTLSSVAYLSRVMEKDGALSAASQIMHTLGDLHRQGIYHGGLRPENIFLTGGQSDEPVVKITGFGEMVTPGLQHLEASNLPFFLAPEQLVHNVKTQEKVAQWDVYSAGVIVYYLLSKHLPRLDRLFRQHWENPAQMDRLVLISQGKLTRNAGQIYLLLENEKDLVWPDQHSCDQEKVLRAVVEKCLAFDPASRFRDLSEVSDALRTAERMLAEKEAGIHAASQPVAAAPVPVQHSVPAQTSVPVTDKIPLHPNAGDSAPQQTVASLDEIFQEEPQNVAKPAVKGGRGVVAKIPLIRTIRSSPILDKIVATVLAVLVISLGASTNMYRGRLAETEQQRVNAVSELRENILKQANTFQEQIDKTRKSAKKLESNLNQVEETKARLEGETTMARGLLKETQANGDRFFKLILENKDTDVPSFRQKRQDSLVFGKKHYQSLIEIYNGAPENFAESTANAHYYLGRIHKEMGEIAEAAQAFSDAEQIYMKLMESERNVEFTENLAISKRELAELAFDNAAFTPASNLYDDSTRFWQELSNLDNSRILDSGIEMNLNSLKIVECHYGLGNRDSALKGAESLANSFLGMHERYPNDDRIVGGLARSFTIIGNIFENSDREKAISAYNQAANYFAGAIQRNAAVDSYHVGLANCLAQAGLLTNDIDRMNRAVAILKEVVPRNRHDARSLIVLADVYGALAAHQRDGGNITNSISLEEEAITLLRPLVMQDNQAIPVEVYHAYSKRLVHLAMLRVDANKFDSSRQPLKEAISLLVSINQSGKAPPAYRRTLASARGLAGFASHKSGDTSSAKNYYKMANEDWVAYMSQNPNDTEAAEQARWAKERLRALQ